MINYEILTAASIIGFMLSIALSIFIFFRMDKMKASNQEMYQFLYRLDNAIKVTNSQIQDSVGKIGQGTNGAIEKFIDVLNISDSISKELKTIRENIYSESEKAEQRERIEKILESSHSQTKNIHEIIGKLQFEDITKQINTHVSELLTLITVELKKQMPDAPIAEVENEIRHKLAEEVIRLSTMKSERDIAKKTLEGDSDSELKKEKSEDVTFF